MKRRDRQAGGRVITHIRPEPVAKRCPYCGRPIKWERPTCSAHDDLPGLEPLEEIV